MRDTRLLSGRLPGRRPVSTALAAAAGNAFRPLRALASRRPRVRFAHQVLILQIGVVLLVAVVGYVLAAWVQRAELRHQFEQRALTLARTVAADPVLGDAVAGDDPYGVVQDRAERIRSATGALFVVVTDRNGIRLAHPNRALLGKRVSTDPSVPLSGHELAVIERGTLGLSARGKVPLYDHVGRLVGEVSVGFDAREIDQRVHSTLTVAAALTSGAVLLGVIGSYAIGRRLKRQTLGLEPHELAELVQEREAVLHGVNEGVVAVDAKGRMSVCNDEASRLLGLRDAAPARATRVAELPVGGRLRAVLLGEREARNLFVLAGERVLVVNRREVRHGGRPLGAVITLRDRTDVESLARELDTVRTLFDALRAQRHEYANRMHTLSGLLQLGHYEEAADYIATLAEVPDRREARASPPDTVSDPYLSAFLSAKAAVAVEKGVHLEIAGTSWVAGRVADPLDVTTVLGNLVDNALEAARLGTRRPARVEVELLGDGADLYVTVADSGEGVPPSLREAIFRDGVSTRVEETGRPRGLGLALARHAARTRGGDVTLASPGRARGAPVAAGRGAQAGISTGGTDTVMADGAVFVARLPGVLR